jgi:hypothetical protein
MTTIAGMDLGFGSQVQLVKTNYLFVGCHVAGPALAQANLLQLYNRLVDSAIKADYITCINDNGTGVGAALAPTNSTVNPVVIDNTTLTNWPLRGPTATATGTVSGDGITATINDSAGIGSSTNGHVLSVLSVGMMDFGVSFAAGAHITTTLGSERRSMSELINGRLGVANVGGPTGYIDVTDLFADIIEAATLNGVADLDLTDANLNASFVAKGNAAGTTATTLAEVGNIVADTCALVSIVALVKTA